MLIVVILGFLSVSACVFRVIFVKKANAKMGFLAKTLCSCAFFASALIAALDRGVMDNLAIFMIIAFMFALLGDVILVLPYYSKEEFKEFFSLVGGGSFLLGHIFYLIVFFMVAPMFWPILPIIMVVPTIFFVLIKFKILELGNRVPLIIVYGFILGALLVSTLNMAIRGVNYVGIFAAVFFILSDTLLFLFNFGKESVKKLKIVSKTFLPLYYLAQALFTIVLCLLP